MNNNRIPLLFLTLALYAIIVNVILFAFNSTENYSGFYGAFFCVLGATITSNKLLCKKIAHYCHPIRSKGKQSVKFVDPTYVDPEIESYEMLDNHCKMMKC